MQRFLYQEFEKNAFRLAQARVRYELLVTKCIIEDLNFGMPGYELPFAIRSEILSLWEMLEFYHPGQYARPDLPEANYDEVWVSGEDPELTWRDFHPDQPEKDDDEVRDSGTSSWMVVRNCGMMPSVPCWTAK